MIIAFTGFKQVGKTTATKYLETKYGFVKHCFKDALIAEIKQNFPDLLRFIVYKEYAPSHVYDIGIEECINNLFVDKPPLMRALLQNYGTEVRRGDDDYYWIDRWHEKTSEYFETKPNLVVDDVRFINEAQAVWDVDGILIRLTRPDITTGGSHASETEQLEIEADYTIECVQGDHEHLYRELDRIVGMVE